MSSQLDLQSIITKEINYYIEKIMDEEIENVKLRIAQRIRGKLGHVATEVFRYVEFSSDTKQLVITVRNDMQREG